MSQELCQLREKRNALADAIAAGVQAVTTDGVTVSYQNLGDMRSVLADLQRQIDNAEGMVPRRPRSAAVYLGGF